MTDCHEGLFCPVSKDLCPEMPYKRRSGCAIVDRCALLALMEIERGKLCAACTHECEAQPHFIHRGSRAAVRLAGCPEITVRRD